MEANAPSAQNKTHLYSKEKSLKKSRYKIPTEHLKKHEVEKFFDAIEKAYEKGYELNRFMTFHIDPYCDKRKPNQFMIDMIERGRTWLIRKELPVAYVYVLENAPIKGIHAHLFIHVPSNYQAEFKKALGRDLPFKMRKPSFDNETITYPPYGELHIKSPAYGLIKYMSKGLNSETPVADIIPSYQGKIWGKRWGMSKTLRPNKYNPKDDSKLKT